MPTDLLGPGVPEGNGLLRGSRLGSCDFTVFVWPSPSGIAPAVEGLPETWDGAHGLGVSAGSLPGAEFAPGLSPDSDGLRGLVHRVGAYSQVCHGENPKS